MKRSGKKMNPRTKRLLIISLVCLITGSMALLIGLFTGSSIWAAWDWNDKKLITSNYVGTFEEKKETDPFTSIHIEVPSATYTIREGDSYSIDMKSCLPGIKPVVQQKDGVLSITMEDYQNMETWQITPFQESLTNDNVIFITVPAGTKLEEIRFAAYEEYSQSYNMFDIYQQVNLENIQATQLNCETGFYNSNFSISESEIDNINVRNINSLYFDGLKADTVQLNYGEDNYYFWYRGNTIEAKEVTANSFIVNYEGVNKNRLFQIENLKEINDDGSALNDYRNINLKNSIIQNLDLMSCSVNLERVETQKATVLTKENLIIKNCNMKGESVLRSAGTILMGLEQPITDFSGAAAAGAGYMNGPVTELVDFGTPEYEHGFVTDESKTFGTQIVKINSDVHYHLQSYENDMMESKRQYTPQSSSDESTTVYAQTKENDKYLQFLDYIAITSEYDEEKVETTYSAEVYNKKAVSYFVNAAGERTYVKPQGNPASLKVNGDTYGELRYQFGSGPNKLDAYSIKNSEFKFGY